MKTRKIQEYLANTGVKLYFLKLVVHHRERSQTTESVAVVDPAQSL